MNLEPSAPRDLTIEPQSSTELAMSWLRPIPTNGIIVQYTLYCRGSDSQHYTDQFQPFSFTEEINGEDNFIVVGNLEPFTSYDCSISATTGAGEGERSTVVVARTDESSKL